MTSKREESGTSALYAKAQQGRLLGLYCHVPFCRTTCDFCAFYQERPQGDAINRYLGGVEGELALLGLERSSDLMFWGGGTPGLLGIRDLERLGKAVLHFAGTPQEWTVEMAPSTVTDRKMKALRALGVTRISLGVQSFDSRQLRALGRRDGPRQIYQAYERIRRAGFDNINIDLMFGTPCQELEDWRKDLASAIDLEPTHISTYCLTFEEDTALWLKLAQGKVQRNADQEAAFYEVTWEVLETAGFQQYEVSNFAQSGWECLHNINTWRMGQWIGIGPAAASQFQGKRFENPASLESWLQGIGEGTLRRVEVHGLSEALLAADALIFGLRMNEGVDMEMFQHWNERLDDQAALPELFNNWGEQGFAKIEGSRVRLTRKGRLVADALVLDILEKFPSRTE